MIRQFVSDNLSYGCWKMLKIGLLCGYSAFSPCRANICRSHLLLACNRFFRSDLLGYGNLIRKQCLSSRHDWLLRSPVIQGSSSKLILIHFLILMSFFRVAWHPKNVKKYYNYWKVKYYNFFNETNKHWIYRCFFFRSDFIFHLWKLEKSLFFQTRAASKSSFVICDVLR